MQLQLETWRYFLWYKRNNILIIAYRRKNSLCKILSIHMLTYPNLSPPILLSYEKDSYKAFRNIVTKMLAFCVQGPT